MIDTEAFTIEHIGRPLIVTVDDFGPGNTGYLVKYPTGAFTLLLQGTGLNVPNFWVTIPENIKSMKRRK